MAHVYRKQSLVYVLYAIVQQPLDERGTESFHTVLGSSRVATLASVVDTIVLVIGGWRMVCSKQTSIEPMKSELYLFVLYLL